MHRRISSANRWRGVMQDWAPRLAFLGLGLTGGATLACGMLVSLPQEAIPANAASGFQLMAEAWNTIQRSYVDRSAIVPTRLTHGAITGMVDALDDTGHSRFLTPDMRRIQQEITDGKLEGIGAEVQLVHDQVVIVAPMDGSPAQRAGLKPGDVVLKVNGAPVNSLHLEEVVGRIAGPAGTPVGLTILTPRTGQTREVQLVRSRLILHSVSWQRLPGTSVAHVRLAIFSKGVTHDLQEVLLDIHARGLRGLILDLRNNAGGLFEEAVSTASQFLTAGDVLLEKRASGQVTRVPVVAGGLAPAIPVVGLINGGTASASEIVAGALKDASRARFVGEKSFGTGTILETFPLSDGSALLLATKEWLTPAGKVIWHQGISPDVPVALPADVTPLLPVAGQGMTTAELRASKDEQLLRALDLLQERLGRT
jgi:carboxyl-terminal processing protease